MVIAPTVPGDPATTYRWAVSAGALLIAPGPYPGSIVVHGSRATLLLPALAHGAFLITARFTGCGSNNLKER
ncbi:hypothetical protein BH10PSE14_BH10PSE14_24040 [soil metagenome]